VPVVRRLRGRRLPTVKWETATDIDAGVMVYGRVEVLPLEFRNDYGAIVGSRMLASVNGRWVVVRVVTVDSSSGWGARGEREWISDRRLRRQGLMRVAP
jgi:hypothetical protein